MLTTKKNACPYCGNNPVNHTLSNMAEMIDLMMSPVYQTMNSLHNSTIDRSLNYVLKMGVWPLKTLGIWNFHHDSEKSRSARSKVIWEEAKRRGIEMEGIAVFGKPIEQHRANIKGTWHYFESLPIPPRFNHASYAWIDDKWKLRNFLQKNKIPMAYGGYARTLDTALEIFKKGTPPFIVKPRVGSRGRHTSTHIYSGEQLKRAFAIAQQLCHFVIIEEQLTGSVYRGTYVNGGVVGILRGDPPRITGDGKHTIRELIREKNRTKHRTVADVTINDHVVDFLNRQHLTLQTILKKGKTIDLSEKIGISYGGFSAEEFPKTHVRILEYLERAGDRIGCPVVGFDFIIDDITKDPDTQRWGIIEANSLPFIDLHHFPLQGKPTNVASKVWDLFDD